MTNIVIPLEWAPIQECVGKPFHYRAENGLCWYEVWPGTEFKQHRIRPYFTSNFLYGVSENYDTIEEAKLAADRDYERRIEAALTAPVRAAEETL